MKEIYKDNLIKWMESPHIDELSKHEVEALSENEEELKARFGKSAGFGTSGIRGLMRAGTNAINVYTIRRATQGLALAILKEGRQADGVVIAYDSRHNSRLFAEEAAGVLSANGIRVFIFDGIRPTPELSFAIRQLGAVAGVNITASHNPKEYNGYKVYWEDGSQISPEKADAISALIESVDISGGELYGGTESIEYIGDEMDEKYLNAVLEQSVAGDYVRKAESELRVVYSAFHGAGAKPVTEMLRRVGIENVYAVPEQLEPNGDFPTVKNPNPEFIENYEYAIEYAEGRNADVIIGTDPDSDRCGVVIKTAEGWKALSGNQIGMLLLDYLLTRRTELGRLPSNAAVIRSVVSTALCDRICAAFGVSCIETLTGFKFIGEKIKEFEESGEYTFIFGFEESIGFLAGTYTRDKDAVVAAMLLAEMACYHEAQGMNLQEALQKLYEKYGYCIEKSERITVDSYDASERMASVMNAIREDIPTELGFEIESLRDFSKGIKGFPITDMLYFSLKENCDAVIRPSGTEPVIKIYIKSAAQSFELAEEKAASVLSAVKGMLERQLIPKEERN